MKKILSVLFLFVATVLGLHAQELVSPNGNFKMTQRRRNFGSESRFNDRLPLD